MLILEDKKNKNSKISASTLRSYKKTLNLKSLVEEMINIIKEINAIESGQTVGKINEKKARHKRLYTI